MKIGIITFHAAMNYGSVLQAFALQEYLRSRGNDVRIIDFRSAAQRRLYPAPVSFGSLYNAKRTVRRLLCDWKEVRFMAEKQSAFRAFASGRLRLTDKCFKTGSALRSYDWSCFDMIVSGSDQIWNPSAIDFSEVYFLNFTDRVRKVAYAPSAGPHPHVSGSMSGIPNLLSCYEAISVREKSTADFFSLGDVPVLPDPVLLHDADFYRTMMPGALKSPSDSNAVSLHDAGGSLTEKERYVCAPVRAGRLSVPCRRLCMYCRHIIPSDGLFYAFCPGLLVSGRGLGQPQDSASDGGRPGSRQHILPVQPPRNPVPAVFRSGRHEAECGQILDLTGRLNPLL